MNRVRTLLIDDSKIFLGIMFEFASRLPGVEVVGFTTSARVGLTNLPALDPDLVVLDLMMPEMNGLEAAAAIRGCGVCPRIIMVSGQNDPEIVRQCIAAGADAFIAKEDLHALLPQTISQWFQKQDRSGSVAVSAAAAPADH